MWWEVYIAIKLSSVRFVRDMYALVCTLNSTCSNKRWKQDRKNETIDQYMSLLFLGIGDLHSVSGCDLEPSKRALGLSCLCICLKLNEGNVAATRHQANLLEPRKPNNSRRGGGNGLLNPHFSVPGKWQCIFHRGNRAGCIQNQFRSWKPDKHLSRPKSFPLWGLKTLA